MIGMQRNAHPQVCETCLGTCGSEYPACPRCGTPTLIPVPQFDLPDHQTAEIAAEVARQREGQRHGASVLRRVE